MSVEVKYSLSKYKGVWRPNTYYDKTDMVFYNGALWVCNVGFTSTGVFSDSNWTCPDCENTIGNTDGIGELHTAKNINEDTEIYKL